MSTNSFNFNGISTLVKEAGPRIVHAIETASTATGVDFAYLMQKAAAESSFNTNAKARTSSATGLFQFLDKTWMSMVKKYGDKYGMGKLADKIDNNGHCSDPRARRQILALRKDPEKAACMAAEYDSENRQYLQEHTSVPVGATELYFAHFMGAGGASSFLNDMQKNPSQNAAKLFPQAAAANPNVFYNDSGKPRTLAQVYDFFSAKFQGDGSSGVQVARATGPHAVTDATGASADAFSEASQQVMSDDDQSANAMVALLSPSATHASNAHSSNTRHPVTITRDEGAITWNGPRMIVSPDMVRIAMLAQTDMPGGNPSGNGSYASSSRGSRAYNNAYGTMNS